MKSNLDLDNLCTLVRVNDFAKYLEGYDEKERSYVLQGFKHGFDIGFRGNRERIIIQNNLPSANTYPEILWEKIRAEVATGCVAGPFITPPFRTFVQSPVGLVPKSGQPGKFRMIFHLSAPNPELSVNGQTPRNLCTIKYHNFDEAVQLVQDVGTEAYMGISDMEHAFRQVPIRKKDWSLLVFKAKDPDDGVTKYFVDKCLPFGSTVSCQVYQRVSNAVSWAVSQKTGKPNVNYLDDFFFTDKGHVLTNWQIDCFLEIASDIGFPVSEEKTKRASMQQCFLGLLLDTLNQFIALPTDKMLKATELIKAISQKKRVTVKQLMSIAGHLNFLTRAIMYRRPYIRRIYDCYAPITQHHNWHLALPDEIRRDLKMWLQFLEQEPYFRPFVDQLQVPATKIGLSTDASGSEKLGFGCFFQLEYVSQQWPEGFIDPERRDPSICWLELYAVAVAVALWSQHFANMRVVLNCDNQAAVNIINSGTSKCLKCMELVRFITGHAIHHNIIFSAAYISTKDNIVADALSRLDLDLFFKVVPEAVTHGRRRRAPPSLWPISDFFQEKLMREGVARSTREAYARAWKCFTQFLASLDEQELSWETKLVMFFTHLSEQGKASSTIRTYMAGVRAHLHMENIPLNENHYMLKLMYKSSAKNDVHRIRLPITKDMMEPLLRWVTLVVKGEFKVLLFRTIFATAYAGAFRIGELVGSEHAVKTKNVTSPRTSDKVQIILHSSKTSKPDQLLEVIQVESWPGSEFCPCALINQFSEMRYRVSKYWKEQPGHFFVHKNVTQVTESETLRILRRALALMSGVENQEYGTHSFRSRKASDMFRKGKKEMEIKEVGRWRSKAFKKYIKV